MAEQEPRVGDRISEYTLEDPLGEGACGQVWKARHVVLNDKVVAIKLPRNPELIHLLKREGLLQHHLDHPGIVQVLGLDLDAEIPYLIQEYVPGKDLARLLREEGKLPLERAMAFFEETVEILLHAHEKGVVHRDLKPSNLLIDLEDHVHVADFGLGKNFENAQSSLLKLSLTGGSDGSDGGLLGTWEYMAPEQRAGSSQSPNDGRADIYALGVILFEMLTGERPAGRVSLVHLSPSVDQIFARCYTSLAERYASASELLDDLRRWKKGKPLSSPAPLTAGDPSERVPGVPVSAGGQEKRSRPITRAIGQLIFFLVFPAVALVSIYLLVVLKTQQSDTAMGFLRSEVSTDYVKIFKDPGEALRLNELRRGIETHPEDVSGAIERLNAFIVSAREPELLDRALRWKQALESASEPQEYEVKLKRFRINRKDYDRCFHSWLEPGEPDIYLRVYRSRDGERVRVYDGRNSSIEGWSGSWSSQEEDASQPSFRFSWAEGEPIWVEIWDKDLLGDNLIAGFSRDAGLSILALSTPLISVQHHCVELESSFALGH